MRMMLAPSCEGCLAGVWYRWFGGGFGGWQEPQLVLLDHGLIVSIPDDLRQHYCQVNKLRNLPVMFSILSGKHDQGQ